MIKSICISLLLVSSSTSPVLAQDKPAFVTEIERVFQEKEPGWKVESKHVQNESSFFKQEMAFRSGRLQAAVSISLWQREKDAHDVFVGTAIAFDTRGTRKTKKSLPNLGDENYMWVNRGSDAWPLIYFRQGKVYVTVFAPSVTIAKRFARHVAEQIPPSESSEPTPR